MQSIGSSTAAELAAVRPLFQRVFARPDRQIYITDARFAAHDAAQRKLWADWSKQHEALAARGTAATIVVLDSALLRGALTALNWISPPQFPQYVTASPEEAIRVARTAAVTHGLAYRPEVFDEMLAWFGEGRARAMV